MDFGTQVGIDAYRKNDFAQAAEQFKDAGIVRGDPTAQILLGQMYYNGEFFKQDYVEAAKWYRKAADQGAKFGLLFLGEMYENGEGVEKDYAEAVKLYRKAAEQGSPEGQMALGKMYRFGYGVEKDYAEAIKLYRKSAEQGNLNFIVDCPIFKIARHTTHPTFTKGCKSAKFAIKLKTFSIQTHNHIRYRHLLNRRNGHIANNAVIRHIHRTLQHTACIA
ncbi:conserved hypothetical protein [Haemophilus influenzae HK1212]|uniref:Sel1 repeat protein n=1 Tax=Haemophilus influenzae HK1212 TaxID=456482 RepID=A0A7G2JXD4_HAEIF|nr:conserved hypothetical protein [Haemophilus influenzae HK1212]